MMQESSPMQPHAAVRTNRYATVENPTVVAVTRSESQRLDADGEGEGEIELVTDDPPLFRRNGYYSRFTVLVLSALTAILFILLLYQMNSIHKQQREIDALTVSLTDQRYSSSSSSLQWLPLPSSDTVLNKIAFGSCSRQDMPQPYWDTLSVLFQPQLTLLMGDNVYGDCDDDACTKLQHAYDKFAAHPSVQGAARAFPMFATLDDHDYGQGDCHADNPYKDIARQKFASFYNLSLEKDLPPDGVYRSRIFGTKGRQLQIILLDTRYGRSPFLETNVSSSPYIQASDSDEQQMLSERQWTWLQEQLHSKTADLRVIVSSIQVLSDTCVFEAWRQLPKERDRLQNMLRNLSSSVILVSGDRHIGAFLRTSDNATLEVTASSWTHTIPFGAYGSNCSSAEECDDPDPRRIGNFVRVNHFGSLEIDWEKREYMVALRRAETTYGSMYRHAWDSDAGMVIRSMNVTF